MTKNRMHDLTNHLFEQMERLNDESLSDEDLDKEIKRAEAMGNIAKPIIEVANLSFKAKVKEAEYRGLDSNETLLIE